MQSIHVRPDAHCGEAGRTLQEHEFFRSLLVAVRYQVFDGKIEPGLERTLLHELDQYVGLDIDRLPRLESVQIGARLTQGKDFSMLHFNDFVWNNGNVPIALQRWELLQDASEVP